MHYNNLSEEERGILIDIILYHKEKKNISGKELSNMIGIHPNTMVNLVYKRHTDIETIARAAQELGIYEILDIIYTTKYQKHNDMADLFVKITKMVRDAIKKSKLESDPNLMSKTILIFLNAIHHEYLVYDNDLTLCACVDMALYQYKQYRANNVDYLEILSKNLKQNKEQNLSETNKSSQEIV